MTTAHTRPTPDPVRTAWDRIAPGFDRYTTPLSLRMGEEALQHAGLRSGMSFLDVGAGSGALSIPAARLGARVTAIDIAPGMLERLRARVAEEGLSDVRVQVMDAHALDLDDDSFDVSGSQHGVSLLPDLDRGLREMVRVTRPGGRVLVSAFGPLPEAEFLTFFLSAIQATIPGFTGLSADPPPHFQVADRAKLRRRLMGAGLHDVRVERTTWSAEFLSGQHLWDVVASSNPIGAALVADLENDQRATVLEVLDGMLRERSGGAPAAILNTTINVGSGTT